VRKFNKPKVNESFQGPSPQRSMEWNHQALYGNKINSQLEACFLNYTKKLDLPADWYNESPSKLWVYNLHYFEDLLSNNAEGKHNLHVQLLNSWVDQNPVGYRNAWEPYPTSLRIVNILKAWLGGLEIDDKLFSSVFAQASFLSSDLERHLLGNHYFVNLKALLYAGVIFKNTRWLSIAEEGLFFEIPNQILEDGANFELSPMYHSLILVDMLDMLNLSKAYPTQVSSKLVALLESYIPKMLAFMEVMAHPDGGVSFFNDSADGIAPTKAKIESYAEKLGFEINPFDSSEPKIFDNANSGYICATVVGNKLIFDASPVGPDYIPGHAHADTLSFELSIGSQRVFVNSGTSEYGLGPKRLNQRRTAAHNTVEVDGKDSSQVWSGFRVANRAEIINRSTELDDEYNIVLEAAHNGYKTLFGGCFHSRRIIFTKDSLSILDSLQGVFRSAKSRFYFHPDLNVRLENHLLIVTGPSFILHSDLTGKKMSLGDSSWYPEFGLEVPNKVLEVQFEESNLEIMFTWKNR
jgi:uncharacterized heparinase superfamily protein